RRDRARDVAAALHIKDDGGTRLALQYILRVKNKLAVGPNNLARLGDHTDTVGVAVKSQAQFAVSGHDVLNQVLQIGRVCGVWMMIGEVAVHITVQRVHLAAYSAE